MANPEIILDHEPEVETEHVWVQPPKRVTEIFVSRRVPNPLDHFRLATSM